jgi:hypothetical protein
MKQGRLRGKAGWETFQSDPLTLPAEGPFILRPLGLFTYSLRGDQLVLRSSKDVFVLRPAAPRKP